MKTLGTLSLALTLLPVNFTLAQYFHSHRHTIYEVPYVDYTTPAREGMQWMATWYQQNRHHEDQLRLQREAIDLERMKFDHSRHMDQRWMDVHSPDSRSRHDEVAPRVVVFQFPEYRNYEGTALSDQDSRLNREDRQSAHRTRSGGGADGMPVAPSGNDIDELRQENQELRQELRNVQQLLLRLLEAQETETSHAISEDRDD